MIEFIKKEPVNKGWSCDSKYCVTSSDGTKYLLRVTPAEKAATRADCFRMQKAASSLGVPMCQPIEYGECDGGVYILQSWIDGRDAEEVIPTMTEDEQYAYGVEAGEILAKIHTIPAPPEQAEWGIRFNAKIDRKEKLYAECPVKFDGDCAIIDYVERCRDLVNGRPQSFQHGDYHIGNMMIDNEGRLRIIDFDRYDFGDPWEEFNRIVWCAKPSPYFASGMVDGYFGGDAPEEFWRLLALYIGSNTLSSVPWAIPFGEGQIRIMLDQARDVLTWYDGMTRVVPSWYVKRK